MLSPYRQPTLTAERKRAIQHAINLMGKGLTWGDTLPRFTRDEIRPRMISSNTNVLNYLTAASADERAN